MKRILLTLVATILFFSIITFIAVSKNPKDIEVENPISIKELQSEIKSRENVLVYFYSPECEHCKKVTSIIKKASYQEGIRFKMLNVLKFERSWDEFSIQGTPTLIYFREGKEEKRLIGERGEKEYTQWFKNL